MIKMFENFNSGSRVIKRYETLLVRDIKKGYKTFTYNSDKMIFTEVEIVKNLTYNSDWNLFTDANYILILNETDKKKIEKLIESTKTLEKNYLEKIKLLKKHVESSFFELFK